MQENRQAIINFFTNTAFPCERATYQKRAGGKILPCEYECPLCVEEKDLISPNGISTAREIRLCVALARVISENAKKQSKKASI